MQSSLASRFGRRARRGGDPRERPTGSTWSLEAVAAANALKVDAALVKVAIAQAYALRTR